MLKRIRSWFVGTDAASQRDDLSQEIDYHLAMLKEEHLDRGATAEQAEAFARRKLGNQTAIRESVHEIRPLASLDIWAKHLLIAMRSVRSNPGVYASTCAILALGLGISVAMFSVVDAVLIRPLPFPDQKSIQLIWKADPLAGNHVEELAYPELEDLRQGVPDFAFIAMMPTSLYGYSKILQNGTSDPVQIESSPVSHNFFRVLGVSPLLGRDFTASDEHTGAAPVVIISNQVWREYLGHDPHIIGHLIRLNGEGYTVIGVLGDEMEFPRGAGLWYPLGVTPAVTDRRGATFLQAIVRVKTGVPSEKVSSEVDGVVRRQATDLPAFYTRSQRAVLTPLVEYWTGSARLHLWIMLGASLLLMAASIVSSGNLLFSRVLQRRSEIATRLAVGAPYHHILAQFSAEAAVVAIIAASAGLGIAHAAIRILVRWAPPDIPRLQQAALDPVSFCFAGSLAALGVIVCTLVPGWAATRINVEAALREGGARLSSSRRSEKIRYAFVAAHSMFTIVLLVLASLLVLSYRAMMSGDIGFANRDAVSMNLQLHGPGLIAAQAFDLNRRRLFYRELLDRLRREPGVSSAAAVLLRPLEGTIGWDVQYELESDASGRDNRVLPKVNYEVVTPSYFATVGTPLLEGRDFSEHDSEGNEPVAIISQSLANRIRESGQIPLGARIRLGLGHDHWTKIIGICGNARYRSITQSGSDVFVPYLQAKQPTNYLVIRGSQSADDLASLVRRRLTDAAPGQAIAGIATIGALIDSNSARHRFNMILLLWFGVCAAILAASGIYSVVTEVMTDRAREIAIKLALGAPRIRLVREAVLGMLAFVLVGEVFGAFGVIGVTRFASGLLYGVSVRDPLVTGFAGALLFALSMSVGVWSAWRITGRNVSRRLT
jgi:putative ABC transport system permease protein